MNALIYIIVAVALVLTGFLFSAVKWIVGFAVLGVCSLTAATVLVIRYRGKRVQHSAKDRTSTFTKP